MTTHQAFPSEQIDIDISENAAPGTRFPLAAAYDPDTKENGLKTYQITRDDYSIFSLDVKSRGDGAKFPELVVQRPLDREERSHHTLIITATDGGEYPKSGTMLINVKVHWFQWQQPCVWTALICSGDPLRIHPQALYW